MASEVEGRSWDAVLCRMIIGCSGLFVPRSTRRDWREEWQGELEGRRAELSSAGRLGWKDRWDLVARACGAIVDAVYLNEGGMMGMMGIEGLVKDVGLAFRSLRRRPAFTAVAIITLALGIGANTALFSIVNGVLLRPLGLGDPDRLVNLQGTRDGLVVGGNVSYPNLRDIGNTAVTLESVAGAAGWNPAFTEAGGAEVVQGLTVSWNYFQVLGVEPSSGRFFGPEDEGEGRAPVVVLAYGVWQRRYGSEESVVGRTVRIDNEAYRVSGVAPEGFEDPRGGIYGSPVDVWRTPDFEAEDWFRSGRSWKGFARLSPGVTVETSTEEVAALMARLEEAYPEENTGRSMLVTPLHDVIVGDVRREVVVLFGGVGFLLLIAGANVANLLLGRAVERRQEMALRRALGASRIRLITGYMTESMVLAVIGGVLGAGLAYLTLDTVVGLAGASIPRLDRVGIDPSVLAFTGVVTLLTGLLFGIAPALYGTDRTAGLAGGGDVRRSTGGQGQGRLRRGLVVAEVSLTVVLLVGAGLFFRSLRMLGGVDVGVSTESFVTMDLHGSAWWSLEPSDAEALYATVLENIAAVPGVRRVGAMDILPMADNASCDGTWRGDRSPPAPGEGSCTQVRSVLPGVFDALGMRLLRGRWLGPEDRPEGPKSALVSEATSRLFWGEDEDAVGTPIVVHGEVWEVVGVVSDVRHYGPGEPVHPHLYLPAVQEPWNGITRGLSLVVRAEADVDPSSLVTQVRDAIEQASPVIPVTNIRTGERMLQGRVSGPRFRTAVLGSFGVVGLLLSMVGIVGVMAFSVGQRTREMGVRMVLGAERTEVRAMVLREGLVLIGGGVAIGIPAALAMGRVLSGLLFGISAADPLILVAVPFFLILVSLAACYVPAAKAARIDPMEALRAE